MTSRPGFTLIEMLVAIVVAAGVVGTARAIVDTVGDAGARVMSAAAAEDEAVGGELLSRSIIRQTRTTTGDSLSLFGTDRGFVVQSWCPVPGGSTERCSATFAVDPTTASLMLQAGPATDLVFAARAHQAITLRYLKSAADGGRWTDWWATTDPPVAVGIIVDADTLIMPVGR
jgi:prepilin-type N-terminal cleavage/methylation domain-containing protein